MPRARKTEAIRLKELEVLQEVIASPLVLFVASFTAIEVMQNLGWVGETAGSVAQLGLGSIAVAQAVGPALSTLLPALVPALAPAAALLPGP